MKNSHSIFTGTLTALATPFTANTAEIDYASLEALLTFQYNAGVQGVVACGSTGEAAALSDDEFYQLNQFVADWCKGKMQCVVGIGTNNLARALEMATKLSKLSLDGILLVTPPYSKPPQRGLIEFFRAVKAISRHPIIAYNVPGRTAVNLLPESVAVLAKEKVIVALKDASGSIDQLLDTQRLLDSALDILSGEDSLIHPAMACGAVGTISASANIIPKQIVNITCAALKGDFSASYDAQLAALPAIRAAFAETNPVPIKQGLFELGIIKSPVPRLPLLCANKETEAKMRSILT